MNNFYKYLFTALLVFGFQEKVDSQILSFIEDMKTYYQYAEKVVTAKDFDTMVGNFVNEDTTVTDGLNKINQLVNSIQESVADMKLLINDVIRYAKKQDLTAVRLLLTPQIDNVEATYEMYKLLSISEGIMHDNEAVTWATSVTDHATSTDVSTSLIKIGRHFEKYMNALIEYLDKDNKDQNCVNSGQSPQLLVTFEYYEYLVRELNGLKMIKYANEILKVNNKPYSDSSVNNAFQLFKNRISKLHPEISKKIPLLSREFARCGPGKPDYIGEVQAFQRFFMNGKQFRKKDYYHCPASDKQLDGKKDVYRDNLLLSERCRDGIISNCEAIGDIVKVCPANDKKSNRRYEFVLRITDSYFNPTTTRYGPDEPCHSELIPLDRIELPISISIYDPPHKCLCTCSENTKNHSNYINIGSITTNYRENKVMTGVRIVNIDGVFGLQIQEGLLLPDGGIEKNTVRWLETAPNLPENKILIGMNTNKVHLDSIDINDGSTLLTGIRFENVKDAILIGLHFSKYHITSTEVKYLGEIGWKNKNLNANRYELPIQKELPKLKEYGHHRNDISKTQFVKFTTTNIEKDVGQTTIPLIDMQPVEPTPHMPLSGAGLYHKAVEGETAGAGYLGVMLYTKDITKKIEN